MSQHKKRQNLCGKDRLYGLTHTFKRQNAIVSFQTEYYISSQLFRQEMRRLDKKMIEKTENDRQIAKKRNSFRQEMTTLSMWITLWKLGISQSILDYF